MTHQTITTMPDLATTTDILPDLHLGQEEPDTPYRVEATLDYLEELTAMLESPTGQDTSSLDFDIPADFRLTIVIPVYNEARTIGQVIDRVNAIPVAKEVIVVDDGSTDGTAKILTQCEAAGKAHVVTKPRNEGKGAALRTAFRRATGDVVVVQDADLEYDPRDILGLLQPIIEGTADVVYGSRFLENEYQDRSWVHRTGNRLLTWASNVTTGLQLSDMETCYKAFPREVLHSFEIQQNRFGFEPEVTAKIARRKYRICERPIRYAARTYAEGKKIGIRDLFNALYCIARYGRRD